MADDTRPARSCEYRLFPALFVIALGVLFLVRNLGYGFDFFEFHNWWAWLILVAAVAPLTRAIELYRASGKVDGMVVHHLFVAGAIVVVRSEERRVGKECRSRWWTEQYREKRGDE